MINNIFDSYNPTWCPGCGNWGILASIKTVLIKGKYTPSSTYIVFGIGCSGNMNDFINAFSIHSLHGRAIPTAIGVKIANPKSLALVVAGDGDTYGEGGNHFIHACRGNHDLNVLVHDNKTYGLTTGQVSPTSLKGTKSKSTPEGIIETPINSLSLALTQGATFIAQAFAGNILQLTEIIQAAIAHEGFSLVNILQPCVTFNKKNTFKYYLSRVFNIQDHDVSDKNKAFQLIEESSKQERYPVGIIYQKKDLPSFTSQIPEIPSKGLLANKRFTDFELILNQYK
jgi:2-oxoglutarate ferredoxin oxidoreductase subunit beta